RTGTQDGTGEQSGPGADAHTGLDHHVVPDDHPLVEHGASCHERSARHADARAQAAEILDHRGRFDEGRLLGRAPYRGAGRLPHAQDAYTKDNVATAAISSSTSALTSTLHRPRRNIRIVPSSL